MNKAEKVVKELEKLGSSPEEVAKALKKRGLKGKLASRHSCPLARYVKSKVDAEVEVDGEDISFFEDVPHGRVTYSISLQSHLADFVQKFDEEEYDFLIEE